MTGPEKLQLLINIDSVWAEEVLRDRGGSMSSDDVYKLTLLATNDEREARLAQMDAMEQRRRRKFTESFNGG